MRKSLIIVYFALFGALVLASCSSTNRSLLNHHSAELNQPRHPVSFELENPEFWNGNAQTIWSKLQQVSLTKLEASQANQNPIAIAWIQLAIISKRDSGNALLLSQSLKEWRKQNPHHPGNEIFASDTALASSNNAAPKNIALILPLSGQFAASGNAVRDGFMSAYYEESTKNNYQQTISFYDTGKNTNIKALYEQAASKGANVIVGPLLKNDVQQLAQSGNFSIPTIALNYTDNAGAANFYEFGLSPQDEAKQAADKAMENGKTRALIIAPQNDWGQRMVKTLSSRWQANGGTISDTLLFTSQTDFSKEVPKLLHASSQTSVQRMQESAQNTQANTTNLRRQDFDVIFLLAPPQSARTIVPLLRFYYVDTNVPIYATSVIFSGKADPAKDNDLNGVTFSDAPLALSGGAPATESSRLYAVGRDAYLISRDLPRFINLPNFPVYASTGALTLTSNHQFYRRLPWTQIHDGHP